MLAQLPSRPLYGLDALPEMEFTRRPTRGISIPLSQAGRLDTQYDSAEGSLSRTSPPIDSDTKAGGQARRRIAVACERCRKRKIKCSGDQGDGRGCNNCRNSGNQKCQFLRVQSTVIPYQVSPRHHLFPQSMSRNSHYSIGPYQAGSSQYGAVTSGFDYYGQPSSHTISRPQYAFPSEEETQTYYNMPATGSPAFMLPSSMNYYSSTASQKAWNLPTSASGRTPQNNMIPEPTSTTTMSPSNGSYISSPSASDVSGTFPSVSSVLSPTIDRHLPEPASTRNLNHSLLAATESNADHMSLNPATYRASSIWNADTFHGDGRYRDGTRSNGVSESQDLGFGYGIPVSSGAGRATTSSDQGHAIASPGGYRAALSGSTELSSDAAATESYGYGTEHNSRRDSIGHLSNGDTYTRLQPSERLSGSYGEVHRPRHPEYTGSRTGIAGLCSEGGY